MKNKKVIITMIVILIVLIILTTIFFINLLFGNNKFFRFSWNAKVSNTLVIDEIYDNNFSSINIDSQMANIYFKKSNNDKTKVIIYGDKNDIKVNTNENKLNIDIEQEDCVFLCFNRVSAKIEIYLPDSYSNKIEISNSYGDVETAEFLNADIKIDSDCGDIDIKGANKIDIKSAYGDVTVGIVDNAKIDADCGDIEIGKVNNLNAKNALGDIKVDYVTNYLNIENNCGDIELENISLNKDSRIEGDLGDIEIGSTNEIYIDADTDLGHVKIKNNYNKSDVVLKIENDCGDIEVDN